MRRLLPLLLPCLLLCASAFAGAQSLAFVRPDGSTVTLGAAELRALPRQSFEATAHEHTQRYTGTDVREVLRAGGVAPPAGLRGALLRRVLVLRAADGYAAVFGFAELDPSLGDKRVYLVDRAGDAALPADEGPWRAVVPGEARPTRWVRQVIRVEVVDLP